MQGDSLHTKFAHRHNFSHEEPPLNMGVMSAATLAALEPVLCVFGVKVELVEDIQDLPGKLVSGVENVAYCGDTRTIYVVEREPLCWLMHELAHYLTCSGPLEFLRDVDNFGLGNKIAWSNAWGPNNSDVWSGRPPVNLEVPVSSQTRMGHVVQDAAWRYRAAQSAEARKVYPSHVQDWLELEATLLSILLVEWFASIVLVFDEAECAGSTHSLLCAPSAMAAADRQGMASIMVKSTLLQRGGLLGTMLRLHGWSKDHILDVLDVMLPDYSGMDAYSGAAVEVFDKKRCGAASLYKKVDSLTEIGQGFRQYADKGLYSYKQVAEIVSVYGRRCAEAYNAVKRYPDAELEYQL